MSPVRRIGDPLRRNRVLWGGICFGIAGVLFGFGSAYMIAGLRATPVPRAYEAITRYIPGGVHTYGAVMVIFAVALLHGLVPAVHGHSMFDSWLHAWLELTALFAIAITVAFACSWALTGVLTWQAMIYWGSISLFSGLCAYCAPDPPVDRRGSVA